MRRAHSLEEVVDAGWAPSVEYLQRRLRDGRISGRKVGRHWVMSDEDLAVYVDSLQNGARRPEVPRIGLSAASLRRRSA